MKRLSMAAALLLVAFSAVAQDQTESENRYRVGAAAAFTDYSGDSSFPIEDSGLGLELYAQAKLNSWFAVEVGYFNSGGFKQDIAPGSSDGPTELRLGGFNISGLAYLPFFQNSESDIDLFVKAGLYDYDIDLTSYDGSTKVPASLGHSTGLLAGAGFVLNVAENLGVRGKFDWVDISNADLWSLSIGVEYAF